MKILLNKYPKGTFKYQKTDGRYINGLLYENLELLAKKIVNDMTFMGVCFSSTLEVGTGKSVLMTQMGEAWTEIVNRLHGTNLTFTQKNLVFRPKDLIERAFEVPKYSFLLVDEWEDAHYWSELGITIRQFFRKCRQLNLFIMIIIPNFFQLPINFALGRSIFAIDVKFGENFDRGYFDFYSFRRKRKLFIKGRKEHNYHVVKESFKGHFLDGYGIPTKEYKDAKRRDMIRAEAEEVQKPTGKEYEAQNFKKVHKNSGESVGIVSNWFEFSRKKGYNILNDNYVLKNAGIDVDGKTYNKNQEKIIDYSTEGEKEKQEAEAEEE